MNSFQDVSSEQINSHGPNTFGVVNQVLTQNNYTSFQSHNVGPHGDLAQPQGQAPMDPTSGGFQYPLMQQHASVNGFERLGVPSGLPANSLPGNMGTMRPPMFNPIMDDVFGPINPQGQQGLPMNSSPNNTSDIHSHPPIETSDSKVYSEVNQYPSINNNNTVDQMQINSDVFGPESPLISGPIFIHQSPNSPNTAMPLDPQIGIEQIPQGFCPPMYPNNSLQMQQQPRFLQAQQLHNQHQNIAGQTMRPRMETMSQRTISREQMPQLNPNVFPEKTPSSQNELWQQQHCQLNFMKGNQPAQENQYSPQNNCHIRQPDRYPGALSFTQQNWRPNNPIPHSGFQNSLPNVAENYLNCNTQPQFSQKSVPSLNQQSNTLNIQENAQNRQIITSVPVTIPVDSSVKGANSTESLNEKIAPSVQHFGQNLPKLSGSLDHSQLNSSSSVNNSREINSKLNGGSFVTEGHLPNIHQLPQMTMAGSSGHVPPVNFLTRPEALVQEGPQMTMQQPFGMAAISQSRHTLGLINPRMPNPNFVHMNPKLSGMVPIRGQVSINFNSLSNDQKSQIMNVQSSSSMQQQGVQVFPQQMVPVGSSMPMVIAGSVTNIQQEKVNVPWGWKRVLIGDNIVYFSPSGIQLKTGQEIKEYLMTEGTCKCGLDCPVSVENAFNFDQEVGLGLE